MQKWVVICLTLVALAAADECPDGRQCEKGQTCCNDPANGYECCPFEQAECCADHTHCCPAGTVCNSGKSSCVNSTVSIPWVERANVELPKRSKSFRMIKPYMGEDEDNICPDQSRCPPEFSCLTALRGFGCCPIAQGVPCSDGKHCCPVGRHCSADSRSCTRQEPVTTVLCSDGVSECPLQTTCCESPEGKWGCCPMPKAVCCEDKLHCCPEGTSCDVQNSKCISLNTKNETPMWAKLPARIRAEWEIKKEAGQVRAAEKSPEVMAVKKVPPSQQEGSVSSVTKENKGNDVPCNDTVACEDGTTCCKTKDGGWACCPLPEAVCCDDFIHCCPKGSTCDLPAQSCDEGTRSVPWLEKKPAQARQSVKVEDVPCDSATSCPDNTTCCKTKEGGWACCPIPEAVCCDDFIHCCPKGMTCDVPAQSCDEGTYSVPWLEKKPAVTRQSVQVEDVPCDSATSCPDTTTCCKTKDGGWACCPLPEAVCCDDFIHCCPKGSTCDLPAQSCDDGTHSVPWLEKKPALTRQSVKVEDVPCDSATSCPDNTTCCKTKEGGWACCSLPEAVCCDDHEHCCPAGTTCDLATLSCKESSGSGSTTPMKKKLPAFVTPAPTTAVTTSTGQGTNTMQTEEKEEEEVRNQCDTHTSCPKFTTCCFMASSQSWGCCPLPEAVCCTDGSFCCPAQYTCNEGKRSCVKGEVVIPWYTKLPATTTSIVSVEADRNSVQCDVLNKCPERSTCCRLLTGAWGCCPLQNAVCCTDKEHCCPQGFHCNIVSKSCQRLAMLQLETVPLTPVYLLEQPHRAGPSRDRDIQCDGQTSCTDMETCCRTSATSWACCPAPNAVCCSDMKHCCPSGYTCTTTGSCTQNMGLLWRDWNMFLANKKRALIV